MKTSDFDYYLPEESIAYHPVPGRHNSRLMLVDRSRNIIDHRGFVDLPGLMREGDLLVLNNTRVIPARLSGKKPSGGEVEVLLLEKLSETLWECMTRGPKDKLELEFGQGVSGILTRYGQDGWKVEFNEAVDDSLNELGKMPLPPYIKREARDSDKIFYQTVYAERDGAIAAPTAGLHFTEELLSQITQKGVQIEYVTLHVGVGTFMPVKTENIKEHKMHSEYIEISDETASAVNRAKREGRRVIAVGTTVVRTLESSVNEGGQVKPVRGRTDIFITPGYRFGIVDGLITNFHMPRSTLMMLVSAFAGRELIMKAYETARDNNYRFLSYGDSMFIN